MAAKVAFIEARLTLLERKFSRMVAAAEVPEEKPTEPVVFSCSEPGLLISKMYPMEKDDTGADFCWIGNDGPVQMVLPIRPC